MADDAKPIEINVGGRIFATTVGTLRFERESMLARLFDPDRGFAPLRTDSAGRPFLDRDGELFAIVLNYLRRGGSLVGAPRDAATLERCARTPRFSGSRGSKPPRAKRRREEEATSPPRLSHEEYTVIASAADTLQFQLHVNEAAKRGFVMRQLVSEGDTGRHSAAHGGGGARHPRRASRAKRSTACAATARLARCCVPSRSCSSPSSRSLRSPRSPPPEGTPASLAYGAESLARGRADHRRRLPTRGRC